MIVVFICIKQRNQQLIAADNLMSAKAIAFMQLDVRLSKA
jgi:hypothetical protein